MELSHIAFSSSRNQSEKENLTETLHVITQKNRSRGITNRTIQNRKQILKTTGQFEVKQFSSFKEPNGVFENRIGLLTALPDKPLQLISHTEHLDQPPHQTRNFNSLIKRSVSFYNSTFSDTQIQMILAMAFAGIPYFVSTFSENDYMLVNAHIIEGILDLALDLGLSSIGDFANKVIDMIRQFKKRRILANTKINFNDLIVDYGGKAGLAGRRLWQISQKAFIEKEFSKDSQRIIAEIEREASMPEISLERVQLNAIHSQRLQISSARFKRRILVAFENQVIQSAASTPFNFENVLQMFMTNNPKSRQNVVLIVLIRWENEEIIHPYQQLFIERRGNMLKLPIEEIRAIEKETTINNSDKYLEVYYTICFKKSLQ